MKNSDIITFDIQTISKEELFSKRICDLGLSMENSGLLSGIQKLYQELENKGLSFKPQFYLTDEWGCPSGDPIVGIPFYLAHPRLKELEKEIILEAEGGNELEFMKLLRHETGHAVNYAYRLYTRPNWRKLFGPFSKDYKETYKARPYSKRYVRHLDNWYAQCHPDEDFAETFAVWLTPKLDWRKQYKGWGALPKLEYVDKLMNQIKNREPIVSPPPEGKKERPISKIKATLKTYYKKKREEYAHEYPDFYDGDLKEIFPEKKDEIKNCEKASVFLKKHREELLDTINFWTAENKYTINELLKDLTERCNELKLVINPRKSKQAIMDISTYLTTLIMNYYYTGRFAW